MLQGFRRQEGNLGYFHRPQAGLYQSDWAGSLKFPSSQVPNSAEAQAGLLTADLKAVGTNIPLNIGLCCAGSVGGGAV